MPSALLVPMPPEPETPRFAVGEMRIGPIGMADSNPLAPPFELPVSPNAWQSAPQPPAPDQLILVGAPLCAAKKGDTDHPFRRCPTNPFLPLKKSGLYVRPRL